MRTYLLVTLSEFDHPYVKMVEEEGDESEQWVEVGLGEGVTLQGPLTIVEQWVNELQMRLITK